MRIPTKLPPSLYQFFWDVDAKKINPGKSPYYVINRLLDKGNLEAVRWVRRSFPKDLITETIKTKKDFSFKTVTFWSKYYQIPAEEIACMQEPFRNLRKQLWPY